jgi:hypothetical protein
VLQGNISVVNNVDGLIKSCFMPQAAFPLLTRPTDERMAAYEKAAIQDALAKSRGNRKKAAQILGIGEATVYRRMRKDQIKIYPNSPSWDDASNPFPLYIPILLTHSLSSDCYKT